MEPVHAKPSFREAVAAWFRVGILSFGGPAGQIAVMHRLLVEEKKWFDEDRFLHALKFCTLLPGPEAQQLATYLGWSLYGVRGGLVAGTLFIVPGVLVILALSLGYAFAANLGVVTTVFAVIRPVVLVIVIEALLRIGRRSLPDRRLLWLALASFLALFLFHVPFPIVVLASGLIGLVITQPTTTPTIAVSGPPSRRTTLLTLVIGLLLWWVPVLVLRTTLGPDHILATTSILWSKAAVVTFGGAYAVLDYVRMAAVQSGWLTPTGMLDGLSLAETTPGPLILVLEFVGFQTGFGASAPLAPLTGGLLGAAVAVWITFVPSFLFVLLGAPYVDRLRTQPRLTAALTGISAAVVGVVANLSVWFALQAIFREHTKFSAGPISLDLPRRATFDPLAAAIALTAAVAMFRFKVGMGRVLLGGLVVGLLLALVRR